MLFNLSHLKSVWALLPRIAQSACFRDELKKNVVLQAVIKYILEYWNNMNVSVLLTHLYIASCKNGSQQDFKGQAEFCTRKGNFNERKKSRKALEIIDNKSKFNGHRVNSQ